MTKIAIDAGHGLYTAGKRCMKSLDLNETREWVLNNRIADKLEVLLSDYECEVLRVDDTTGLTDVSLAQRVKKANNFKADIYISIHHNAGVKGGKGGGIVVYHWANNSENKASAKKLYDQLIKATGLKGNRATPVSGTSTLYVVKNTLADCFLIENGFMDSAVDVPIILSEAHAKNTALGLLNFLVNELHLTKKKSVSQGVSEPQTDLYKVQCGAFKNKSGAETLKKKLIAAGFEAVVVSG